MLARGMSGPKPSDTLVQNVQLSGPAVNLLLGKVFVDHAFNEHDLGQWCAIVIRADSTAHPPAPAAWVLGRITGGGTSPTRAPATATRTTGTTITVVIWWPTIEVAVAV